MFALPLPQSHSICLCVYNTTLLGLANVAIQLALSGNTAMKEAASSFSAVAGTLFIVSVLFGPKVYRVSATRNLLLATYAYAPL